MTVRAENGEPSISYVLIMRYIDEFRSKNLVLRVAAALKRVAPLQEITIMEVCGTHTQSFYRFALQELLPATIRLISGPGCPVCVSPAHYLDAAIALTKYRDTIVVSFGDMLRIPGTTSTLEQERARSGALRVAYSPLDSLQFARANPAKKVIFLAVGFETTVPAIALTLLQAKKERLKNLFFLTALKCIPPAMRYLLEDTRLHLDGFLCPGHVSAVIGTKAYNSIVEKYRVGCCVAGFEPLDILEGLYLLVRQVVRSRPAVENQYSRVVTPSGNRKAQEIIARVFRTTDTHWRGLGEIPKSGLRLKDEFSHFDAEKAFGLKPNTQYPQRHTKCKCGDVLKGLLSPQACPLFARGCTIEHPLGPCMVSNEGACNAIYKYRK